MTDLTAPIDPLLSECVEARREIREAFNDAKARAATWTPKEPS